MVYSKILKDLKSLEKDIPELETTIAKISKSTLQIRHKIKNNPENRNHLEPLIQQHIHTRQNCNFSNLFILDKIEKNLDYNKKISSIKTYNKIHKSFKIINKSNKLNFWQKIIHLFKSN